MNGLHTEWQPNVVIADLEWIDRLVFDITVNFERLLNRPLPKADLCQWLDYICLDAGLRPGNNKVQAVFICHRGQSLRNCTPADIATALDGQAFKSNIAEYTLAACPVESEVISRGEFFAESLQAILNAPETDRIMIVGDTDTYGRAVSDALSRCRERKDVTLFTLQPVAGFRCAQEFLSYSLLATLGISSDELPNE